MSDDIPLLQAFARRPVDAPWVDAEVPAAAPGRGAAGQTGAPHARRSAPAAHAVPHAAF